MAAHQIAIQAMASKLGVDDEKQVLAKAAELERLLQLRSTVGINMSDTSKLVICLDLASTIYNVELDLDTAVKYSGLKRSAYLKTRKVMENALGIYSGRLTIPHLCIYLHCVGVESLAQQILDEYQKRSQFKIDFNLPQYVCIAVYHACRLSKIKVPKRKLIDKCFLTSAQWDKLDAMFTKVVDEHFIANRKITKRSNETDHFMAIRQMIKRSKKTECVMEQCNEINKKQELNDDFQLNTSNSEDTTQIENQSKNNPEAAAK